MSDFALAPPEAALSRPGRSRQSPAPLAAPTRKKVRRLSPSQRRGFPVVMLSIELKLWCVIAYNDSHGK